ncbi:MAG: PEP-CTERM sorting domain-containing protein [Tepidisphaeraceae bacterium]|jgi:PEP-CTERM motif-containing protein
MNRETILLIASGTFKSSPASNVAFGKGANTLHNLEDSMRCNLLHSMTVCLTAAVCFLSLSAMRGFGDVINLNTATPTNWVITGGGAIDAPAFAYAPLSGISVYSSTGAFVNGGSNAQFNGFWYADAYFQIPSNASSVALDFSTLQADDRVVLELNGTILGDYFLNGYESNPPLTGLGVMSFPPGPPDVPYTFTGISSGIVTNGFILGGDNDLRMIVNNTGEALLTAPTVNGGPTHAQLTAFVSYSVPEPSSLGILGIGLGTLLYRRRIARR